MTSAAKRVTDRANPALGQPTFSAGAVRALLAAFERLGHDVPSLLSASGLRPSDLDDPDAGIPCAALGAVCVAAQQRRPLANLWLRLAQETPLGAYPLMDYLIVTSSSVGEGMRRYARNALLTGAPLSIDIREDERPIRVIIDCPGDNSEYAVSLTVLHLVREAAGPLRPEYVSFTHQPDDRAACEKAFGCPVRVKAPWSGFALSSEAWRLPMRRRDPILQGVLERHAAEIVARIPAGEGIVTELRRVLAKRVAGGDTRVSAVARDLGTSVRTLQRRLAAAGVSYQRALDQSRCEVAERHLGDASLSIAEVSWLMGYSEPSAFHRAFKRWRGLSPQAFRHRPRATAPR
jgi:AraC-like DNA-binding protein